MILHRYDGFTLIELSIVLVIIGLVVGGVLIGQDLIHAATIRSGISQLERFNVAALTFQTKYNCLPGDCINATDYGFAGFAGQTPNGDGDGRIGFIYGNTYIEMYNFFKELRDAGLIADSFLTTYSPGSDPNYFIAGQYTPFPPFAQRQLNSFVGGTLGGWLIIHNSLANAITDGSQNYEGHAFYLIPTFGTWPGACVSPLDAGAIDTKIDDGLPFTGNIIAIDGVEQPINGSLTNYGFTYGTNFGCTNMVNNPAQFGNTNAAVCNLKIKAQF